MGCPTSSLLLMMSKRWKSAMRYKTLNASLCRLTGKFTTSEHRRLLNTILPSLSMTCGWKEGSSGESLTAALPPYTPLQRSTPCLSATTSSDDWILLSLASLTCSCLRPKVLGLLSLSTGRGRVHRKGLSISQLLLNHLLEKSWTRRDEGKILSPRPHQLHPCSTFHTSLSLELRDSCTDQLMGVRCSVLVPYDRYDPVIRSWDKISFLAHFDRCPAHFHHLLDDLSSPSKDSRDQVVRHMYRICDSR
mmetsp:Transcript_4635/g.16860  ORF Transcript_4635/g.16860 Transcript_4635/m.16860 type:complete len:248 (-) Transcript_4635:9-752(-)